MTWVLTSTTTKGNCDMLFASKLDLLLAVNASERVDFGGPHRRKPLQDSTVYPRPTRPLQIRFAARQPRTR